MGCQFLTGQKLPVGGSHHNADILKVIEPFTGAPVHGIAAVTVMFTIEELNHRIIGVQGG